MYEITEINEVGGPCALYSWLLRLSYLEVEGGIYAFNDFHPSENHEQDDGEQDDFEQDDEMSEREKKTLIELLSNEGKPGWENAIMKAVC